MLFRDFLNLDIELREDSAVEHYSIRLANDSEVIIEDHLFGKTNDYLSADSIPSVVNFKKLPLENDTPDIPVIYGNAIVEIQEKQIRIGVDIIAAAFFMLSRMEEVIIDDKDEHGRFPMESSLAWKKNFYHLPVVDMYLHLLADCLKKLDPSLNFDLSKFEVTASHDLDHLVKWDGFRSWLGALKRGAKQGSLSQMMQYSKKYIGGDDPYDNIDYLISLAKQHDVYAVFYFLTGGETVFDQDHFDQFRYKADKYSEKILKAGFEIALHPSYDSSVDDSVLLSEKTKMESWIGKSIDKSRQHYLRFSVPDTWRQLETAGITEDSSMIYSKWPGFRCGTSRTFQTFDVIEKKALQIRENPLIFMDTAYLNEQSKSLEEKKAYLEGLKNQVRRYGGKWHFLIHNSNFFWQDEREYFEIWHSLYKIR